MTRRMLAAIANPHLDILGHCTGRKLAAAGDGGDRAHRGRPRPAGEPVRRRRPCSPPASTHGKAVEINCRPDRLDPPKRLLRQAYEAGCLFTIDTDAHAPGQLDWLDNGCERAALCGVEPDRVVNTWPADQLLDWAAAHARDVPAASPGTSRRHSARHVHLQRCTAACSRDLGERRAAGGDMAPHWEMATPSRTISAPTGWYQAARSCSTQHAHAASRQIGNQVGDARPTCAAPAIRMHPEVERERDARCRTRPARARSPITRQRQASTAPAAARRAAARRSPAAPVATMSWPAASEVPGLRPAGEEALLVRDRDAVADSAAPKHIELADQVGAADAVPHAEDGEHADEAEAEADRPAAAHRRSVRKTSTATAAPPAAWSRSRSRRAPTRRAARRSRTG